MEKKYQQKSWRKNSGKNSWSVITYTMQIIENIWNFDETLADLEATLNDYTDINQNHVELTEKILQKMVDVTKDEFKNVSPNPTKKKRHQKSESYPTKNKS